MTTLTEKASFQRDIILLLEEIRQLRQITSGKLINQVQSSFDPEAFRTLQINLKEEPQWIKDELWDLNKIYLEFYPVNDRLCRLQNLFRAKHIPKSAKESLLPNYNATFYRKQELMKKFISKKSFFAHHSLFPAFIDTYLIEKYWKTFQQSTRDKQPIVISDLVLIPNFPFPSREVFDSIIDPMINNFFDYQIIYQKMEEINTLMQGYYQLSESEGSSFSIPEIFKKKARKTFIKM